MNVLELRQISDESWPGVADQMLAPHVGKRPYQLWEVFVDYRTWGRLGLRPPRVQPYVQNVGYG